MNFNNIPTDVRVPLFWGEISNRAANSFTNSGAVLIIGITAIEKNAGKAFLATDDTLVANMCGRKSMAYDMYQQFRRGNTTNEVWILPVAENSAGVAATGSLTLTGTATAAGILNVYIGGEKIQVPVAEEDTATNIATALAEAINASDRLLVKATAEAGVVTVTCAFKGAAGNDIPMEFNLYGVGSGEYFPTGIDGTVTQMTNGAGNPDLTLPLNALGDTEYDYTLMPFTDTNNLNAARECWNDITGRWAWNQQIYGHVFTMFSGSASEAQTLGASRNDPHTTIAAAYGLRQAPWLWLAAYVARVAARLTADPARPCQTLELIGIIPPADDCTWNMLTRNTLLKNGISTFKVVNGSVQIERLITTYQRNKDGQADISYLDVNTVFTLPYIMRRLRNAITSKFPDYKLADDNYKGTDNAVVTPGILKAEIISEYNLMATQSPVVVENVEAFKSNLIVERDSNDNNRVNCYLPPDLVNQFRVFAVLNEFRLNY